MYIKTKPISLLQLNKIKQEKVDKHLQEHNANQSYITQKINLEQNNLEQSNSVIRINLKEPIINNLNLSNISYTEFSSSSNLDNMLNAESINKYFSTFTVTNTSSCEVASTKVSPVETPLANKPQPQWNNSIFRTQLHEQLKNSISQDSMAMIIEEFPETSEEESYTLKNPSTFVFKEKEETLLDIQLRDFKTSKNKLKDLTNNFFTQSTKELPQVSVLTDSEEYSRQTVIKIAYPELQAIEEQRKVFSKMSEELSIFKKRNSRYNQDRASIEMNY